MVSTFRKSLVIPPEVDTARLDKVLAELVSEVSRSQLTQWIREGSVLLNQQVVKPTYQVQGGESIEIDGSFTPSQDWSANAEVSLVLIYEDEHLLVLNKPANLTVHPGAGTNEPTLANGLLAYLPDLESLPRVGIVHRLDKDTTGVMVVAKTEVARQRLIEDLAERRITRRYWALVEGRLLTQRVVNLPLGRSSRNRTLQTVRQDGKPAVTKFTPNERYRSHTWLRAQLETGRTHQIRVHAARIGLPLVGDRQYGSKGLVPPMANEDLVSTLKGFNRQALHAYELRLNHPVSQENMRFEVPLPKDLKMLRELLQADAADNLPKIDSK